MDNIDNARSYHWNREDYMKGPHHSHEGMTPLKTKQMLLRMPTTECLLNTTLHGKFTIVRSDFSWFGPSLSHTSLMTVLKFFGVQNICIDSFQRFLNAPIEFTADGPTASMQTRKRGVPMSHSISNLLGKVLLLTMDFAVNQKTNGLFQVLY